MKINIAQFRFYEELNDFLSPEKRKIPFFFYFNGNPAINDAIEALGVPHTEVDLILVNGLSVDFSYQLQDRDEVSVYPVFESLEISAVSKVRAQPLRQLKFVLDVHLGKLARLLRLLGCDALYRNDYDDEQIIDIAKQEHRIILTRDRGILKNSQVTHGYCVRSCKPMEQVQEVLQRFDLYTHLAPFSRCLECNGIVSAVTKVSVSDQIPIRISMAFDNFWQCMDCGRLYWRGSHYEKLRQKISDLMSDFQDLK